MPTNRTATNVLAAVVLLATAACGFPAPASGPVHTYLLRMEGDSWKGPSFSGKPAPHGVLLISPAQAEAGFETRQMAYLMRPYEVSYYATNQWADTPARMLDPLLTYSLERSGLWKAVVPLASPVRGDYRIETRGLVLQQEFMQRPSAVRISLQLQLIKWQEQKVVGARRIEIVEEAPSDDAYGGVIAANRAVTKLLEQAVEWLGACLNEGRDCTS